MPPRQAAAAAGQARSGAYAAPPSRLREAGSTLGLETALSALALDTSRNATIHSEVVHTRMEVPVVAARGRGADAEVIDLTRDDADWLATDTADQAGEAARARSGRDAGVMSVRDRALQPSMRQQGGSVAAPRAAAAGSQRKIVPGLFYSTAPSRRQGAVRGADENRM